jgi:hypothetical protein
MKRALVLCGVALACTSCSLFHGGVSTDHDGGRTEIDAAISGAHDSATTPAATRGEDSEAVAGQEVWIGELWSLASVIFCDPEHPLAEHPSGTGGEGSTWRVVLKLDVRDPNALDGEILFGDAVPRLPVRPDIDLLTPGGPPRSFWNCSFQLPVEGVGYRVLSGRSTSDGVELQFAPNQIWEQWCATEKFVCPEDTPSSCELAPTCLCDQGECHADLRSRRRIQLSRAAETLEGHVAFLETRSGTPADIRLRRVR